MSKKKLLLASQRIEVGALLHGTTLNPRAFRWGVADSETTTGAQVTRLEYANGSTPDRKSTRLNSSHVEISYAVFCLKKKHGLKLLVVTIVLNVTEPTPDASTGLREVARPLNCSVIMRRPLATLALKVAIFFFNDTATTEIYTLSLHDALPI